MKALVDQIKLQKDIYIIGVGIIAGLYVLGTILHEVIIGIDSGQTEVFCMGSMMGVIGIFVALIFGVMSNMVNAFNYAISLGRTRKGFFTAYTLAVFVTALILEMVAKLLHSGERMRLAYMYPLARIDDPAATVLEWNILLTIALLGTAFGIFFSSLVIKFGKVALWALTVVWVAICIGLPRLIEMAVHHPDHAAAKLLFGVAEWFFNLGGVGLPAVALVVSAVILLAAYLVLHRQQVNL